MTIVAGPPREPEPGVEQAPTEPPGSWRARVVVAAGVGAVVLAALPALFAAKAALGLSWFPSGDWAVIVLRVRDVGSATPLVGPYSRYGWNHPGPLMYYLLAVPYHLLGDRSSAVLVGTGLLNGVTMGAMVAVAWRRGRLPFAVLTAAALGLLAHAMGPSLLRDPWNPYLTVLPLGLLVLLTWSWVEGDRWALPAALVVASFVIESHVAYAMLVLALATVAAVVAYVRRHRLALLPPDRRRRRWYLAAVVGSALLCWLPVVADQLWGSGNLADIVRYFVHQDQAGAGLAVGLGQAARHLAVPSAPWLGAFEPAAADGALPGGALSGLVVPVALFALAAAAAVRGRAYAAARLQLLVGTLAVAGVVATSRITGPVFSYLVRWWWVVACLWWLSVAWSATCALTAAVAGRRAARWAVPAVVGLAAVVALASALPTAGRAGRAGASDVPNASESEILSGLAPPVVKALAGSGPVMVRATGTGWRSMRDGILLQIARSGVPIVAEPGEEYRIGQNRSISHRTPVATVWVVSADASSTWASHPGMVQLARWDPLTPQQRAAFLSDEAVLKGQFEAAGRPDLAQAVATGGDARPGRDLPGVDPVLFDHIESIRQEGDPVAVFLGPPPAADGSDPLAG